MNSSLRFLEALYGDDAPGFLPLCTPNGGWFKTRWVPARDLDRVTREAARLARTKDVYFGLGLHPEALGEGRRGVAAHVIAIPGFWADIDIKAEFRKKKDLPPTESDALKMLEAIPLPPTLIVHSGYGLQAWYLFGELWIFENEEERKEAQDLSCRFQTTLKVKAAEYGWSMDSTHDISRVLRTPGSYNRKLEPVEVRVLRHDEDNRCNPQDFEPYLLEMSPEGERKEARSRRPESVRPAPDLSRLSRRMQDLIRHGNHGEYPCRSRADMAVCTGMFGAGYSEAEVWVVMTDPANGISEKFLEKGRDGERYLELTIGKAEGRTEVLPRRKPSRSRPRRIRKGAARG